MRSSQRRPPREETRGLIQNTAENGRGAAIRRQMRIVSLVRIATALPSRSVALRRVHAAALGLFARGLVRAIEPVAEGVEDHPANVSPLGPGLGRHRLPQVGGNAAQVVGAWLDALALAAHRLIP